MHELPYYEAQLDFMVAKNVISGVHPNWPEKADAPGLVGSDGVRRALRDLCEKCWTATPAGRPTMCDIIDKLDSFQSTPKNSDPI